jgi:hypothetical protein
MHKGQSRKKELSKVKTEGAANAKAAALKAQSRGAKPTPSATPKGNAVLPTAPTPSVSVLPAGASAT